MAHKFPAVLKRTFNEWRSRNTQLSVAALSFFTLFSLTPFFIVVITVVNYIGHPLPDPKHIFSELSVMVGGDEGRPIRRWLRETAGARERKATLYSLLFLFIGASTVFVNLQRTLEMIWAGRIDARRGWRNYVKLRLAGIILVAIVIIFMLTFFLGDTVLSIFTNSLGGIPGRPMLSRIASLCVSFLVLTGAFSVIFKFMAAGRLTWREATEGAMLTSILFAASRALLRAYFMVRPIGSVYGSAAWAIVIPIWTYFSWQVFLFGAHLTWEQANRGD